MHETLTADKVFLMDQLDKVVEVVVLTLLLLPLLVDLVVVEEVDHQAHLIVERELKVIPVVVNLDQALPKTAGNKLAVVVEEWLVVAATEGPMAVLVVKDWS